MKTTAVLAVILSATTALAGTINASPEVMRALARRQGEGDLNKCPGGQDFNFCVPFLNWTCPPGQGVPGGALPQPNPGCTVQNNQICACWCSCSKEQCDAALLDLPDYC